MERFQRLVIGDANVLGTSGIFQKRVFGANPGIIEAGRNRMRFGDLAVVVAQHVRAVAMQHARPTSRERRGMMPAGKTLAGCLGADDAHLGVIQERVEQADRVGAAADASGQQHPAGDHIAPASARAPRARRRVEIAHHQRIRMRPGHRADDVERVGDVRDPVAHRLVQRILQRLRAGCHRHHFGTEQFHAVDIDLLPLDVHRAHVDHALRARARGHRGAGHAVLAGAGLGDDARLAHAPGDQRLAHRVVDLVRAGVVQVFALEQDLRAATCCDNRSA